MSSSTLLNAVPDARSRGRALLVATLLALFAAPRAGAQTTPPPCFLCHWPTTVTTVGVWLDWATFTSAACAAANPFTQNELQNLLVRAMETWNTESGSAVTLQFMSTSSTNGPVRVTAACIGNFAGRVVMANQNQYQCDTGGTMQFQLQLNQLQASGYDGNCCVARPSALLVAREVAKARVRSCAAGRERLKGKGESCPANFENS
jgi:hypothetical protein